ncbi:TIR domain-containing protein [Achromobacter mucicolens]|nr:TIR domain-containing protein [Achromobacter mucicolens]
MMRQVFYSFHYLPDNWRASQVRNMGVVEGSPAASDNDWEAVKRGGDAAIQKWIDGQLNGRTCTVVLIGEETARRKWIDYEIHSSWNAKKGIVGIHVHNLKNVDGQQSAKGENPFAHIRMQRDNATLSSLAKVYDPPFRDSKQCYDYISQNLGAWIEEAIKIRNAY